MLLATLEAKSQFWGQTPTAIRTMYETNVSASQTFALTNEIDVSWPSFLSWDRFVLGHFEMVPAPYRLLNGCGLRASSHTYVFTFEGLGTL